MRMEADKVKFQKKKIEDSDEVEELDVYAYLCNIILDKLLLIIENSLNYRE